MSRTRTAALLAPLLLTGALLAGCGEDDGRTASDPADTASATPAPSDSSSAGASGDATQATGPDCAEVWVAGETLPRGYEGCDQDGQQVKADGRYCEFGKPLVTFDDRFWAVPGGRIGESDGPLLQDAAYKDALRKCGG